ncbi:MAG: hypothetical protein LH606_06525 [Cytophagaceae bacterium]|nr:hypothetical protein [Cytophagaceae bacterium]
MSQKALRLSEINQAVNFDEPIGPDHPFFTDFTGVRGEFEEQIVYRNLNVDIEDERLTYDPTINSQNKVLFFLGGMRGSGKTSELQKYAKKLHHPDCFFCVTCNIDDELDLNNLEYMDVLVFQLEKLTESLRANDIRIDLGAMQSLEKWFGETVREVNRNISGEVGIEIGGEAEAGGFWSILKIFGSLKAGMKGSYERATSVRITLKNRFDDFASQFDRYVEEANAAIREQGLGQEVLFIVDGLEKTMTAETRRKVILEESNRIRQINAYTLFTLPIELMRERQKLGQFAFVETFPFVKLIEKDGQRRPDAVEQFREFVYKRIDKSLFESEEVVDDAICYGGGSPRELLKILKTANVVTDRSRGVIDRAALDKALRRLANQTAQYLSPAQWATIKTVVQNNRERRITPFDDTVQDLLERLILMEYNDGNYKRPNPILELSDAYREYVENPA